MGYWYMSSIQCSMIMYCNTSCVSVCAQMLSKTSVQIGPEQTGMVFHLVQKLKVLQLIQLHEIQFYKRFFVLIFQFLKFSNLRTAKNLTGTVWLHILNMFKKLFYWDGMLMKQPCSISCLFRLLKLCITKISTICILCWEILWTVCKSWFVGCYKMCI